MAGALLALAPSGALAQEALTAGEQTARLHFQTGASYYETGNYADALREFQRAYAISQRPELFHNYSRCYEYLGDFANAVVYLRRYLQEVSTIDNRETLEVRLRNLEQRAAAAASTEAATDEPAPSAQAPSAPTPSAQAPSAPAPSTQAAGGEAPIGAIVLFGVAGATLVAGGITGGLVLGEHATLQSGCGVGRGCTDDELSTLRTLGVVTDVSFGVSLATAVVATVLVLAAGSGGDEQASQTAVLPYVTTDGGGMMVGGTL
jgi:hypothetical protein